MARDPIRLFVDKQRFPLNTNHVFYLNEEERHYSSKVLRQKSGDQIEILDGQGQVAFGTLRENFVEISSVHFLPSSSPFLTLYMGLLKGDKMDWVVEKSTELGVDKIVPLVSTLGLPQKEVFEVFNKKYSRWHNLAEAASRQSNRIKIPLIEPPVLLKEMSVQNSNSSINLIFHEKTPDAHWPLTMHFQAAEALNLFIGPEGGFSSQEISSAQDVGFLCCGLGALRLRAETAAMFAVGLCRYSTFKKE